MNDTVSIEDFARIANVKVETIKRRAKVIPGISIKDGNYVIVKGTRYPGKFKNYKYKDSAKRRYVLLKAISEYKYINHLDLRIYEEQFIDFIKDLLLAGLIKENNMPNHYGANAYDCTDLGEEVLKKTEIQAIKSITDIVASASGRFTGAVLSEFKA